MLRISRRVLVVGKHAKFSTMILTRAIRGVLRIRYLLLGGAVTGGYKFNQKYDEWKDGLPDLAWLKEVIPDSQQLNTVTGYLIHLRDTVKDNIEIDSRFKILSEQKYNDLKLWFDERWENAVEAAEKNNNSKGYAGGVLSLTKIYSELKAEVIANHMVQNKGQDQNYQERVSSLQEELINLQTRYQRELDKLEKENKELRKQNILLRTGKDKLVLKKTKKSLIEMYSDVLDELSEYGNGNDVMDQLPRIVVVGDQSAGKTSVLEMVAQARIFPRGAGEMMTRAPVKVTLCEGPYHIAQFRDSAREYDLTNENDLAELRKEVEMRMLHSVRGGRTVSHDVISMSVKGPGLPRMVLVDLPGVISTQTVDMAKDTRESIKQMIQAYMNNPNAIILCIQDGSVDAERSNVTDLVSQCDPSGKRTIFVLTKVDLAEENLANPDRIRRILSGKLFPMKALGYFAVVTGRGRKDDSIQTIKDYEEKFFKNSKFFKDGLVRSNQVTTKNLSLTLSECFWSMVHASIEQQADAFKASRFNLETEWKNNFPRSREMDRDELFERGRNEILDQSINLSMKPPIEWDTKLMGKLWSATIQHVFENIYMPAVVTPNDHTFNTAVDISLKKWAEDTLPVQSVTCAWETLQTELKKLFEDAKKSPDHDNIFDTLNAVVLDTATKRHTWEGKAKEILRTLQLNALQDQVITNKRDWDDAVNFLESSIKDELTRTEEILSNMMGPTFTQRWLYWWSPTEEQNKRKAVRTELENFLKLDSYATADAHQPQLTYEELSTVKKNLQNADVQDITSDYIEDTWTPLYRRHILRKRLMRAYNCQKSFYLYQNEELRGEMQCSDVVLFWRIRQMLKITSNALRQQITNREVNRLHKELKDILDDFGQDPDKKNEVLIGRRVLLANELKRVRQIQEKLEEFITALKKEKR